MLSVADVIFHVNFDCNQTLAEINCTAKKKLKTDAPGPLIIIIIMKAFIKRRVSG